MKALLILGVLVCYSLAVICPKNRLQFFSHYSLGKQDELNRTFDAIGKNLTFPEVIFNASTDRYRIGDYNVTWRYIDTNQKANTTRQDTVIVYGGHLRVDVDFNWNVIGSSTRNGTGSAIARTETIQFSKNLTVDEKNKYVMWNLVHHLAVDLDENKVVLQRLNPSNEVDSSNITKMLNHMMNNSGFADLFVQGVNTLIDFYLNDSLHEEHFQQQRFLNYTFNHPTKGPIIVEYDVVIGSALIQSNGLHIFSSDTIKDYNQFQCGTPVPDEPQDVTHFGGLQTFLSQGFVESTAKYALSKGIFDTVLNEDIWQSRHFQFFAGDLYDVIPAIQKKFYPRDKLNGNCKALTEGFQIIRGTSETFNVTINYNCNIDTDSARILDFNVASHLVLKGVAEVTHIDLIVTHADFSATYHGIGEYQINNTELANYYLNGTTWTLRNTKVFGSNFSTIARDYPHFQIHKDGYVTVYDSSQVGLKTE